MARGFDGDPVTSSKLLVQKNITPLFPLKTPQFQRFRPLPPLTFFPKFGTIEALNPAQFPY
jgi:hypothetical protein